MSLSGATCIRGIDTWPGVPCFPMLFAYMMRTTAGIQGPHRNQSIRGMALSLCRQSIWFDKIFYFLATRTSHKPENPMSNVMVSSPPNINLLFINNVPSWQIRRLVDNRSIFNLLWPAPGPSLRDALPTKAWQQFKGFQIPNEYSNRKFIGQKLIIFISTAAKRNIQLEA